MSSFDNDGSDSAERYEPGSIPDRRFKLSRACDRCRHRRIKCDEGHPCQPCLTSKSDCMFTEQTARRNPQKPPSTIKLEARMRQLESIIDAIPPQTLAAIQAGIYSEDSPGPSGPWSILQSPRSNGDAPYNVHYQYPSHTRHQHSAPVYRGLAHGPGETGGTVAVPSSKFFVDEQGDTQWHGPSSCLPLLEMLIHAHGYRSTNSGQYGVDGTSRAATRIVTSAGDASASSISSNSSGSYSGISLDSVDPSSFTAGMVTGAADDESVLASSEVSDEGSPLGITWATISSAIPAELMDELVRAFLSTSYYLYPFLHLPTFLQDYSSPTQWSDTGFTSFIVSLCCLSSIHTSNPALRANSSVAGKWFELFLQLRTMPGAERPTLYAIQAAFVGAVYAFGKGLQSKGVALLAEASNRAIEAGLHRNADSYDWFDPIQDQIRKRTFWCIYVWDKHASAQFGRIPTLRLRDCDCDLPALVTDEQITLDTLNLQSSNIDTLMGAFSCMCQLGIVLEGVLDTPPSRVHTDQPGSFLSRATVVCAGMKQNSDLVAEEALLEEAIQTIPAHWRYSSDTLSSGDIVRISQAERLHCFASYIRMLIYRRRFSIRAAKRVDHGIEGPQTEEERRAIHGVHAAASEIVAVHQSAVDRGLVTYYGIHNVHQLIQVTRSNVAIILEARVDPSVHSLLPAMVDNTRTASILCRHFGDVYPDGLRAAGMLDQFCALTQIPLGMPINMSSSGKPKYVNHIRKRPTARGVGSPLAINSNLDLFRSPSTTPRSVVSSDVIPNISGLRSQLNTPVSALDSTSSFRPGPL